VTLVAPQPATFGEPGEERLPFPPELLERRQRLRPEQKGLADARLAAGQRHALAIEVLPGEILDGLRPEAAVQAEQQHQPELQIRVLEQRTDLLRLVQRLLLRAEHGTGVVPYAP